MAEIVDFGLQQHKIKMDSRYFENVLSVVAGDTGRRIEVQLLDTNGMVQDTTGLNLRLNAVIAGKATYTDATLVDAATGKYQLDLSNGMFLAPGSWQFQWQIIDSAGKKLHSFAFTGNVGSNISEGGSQATNFYLNLEDLKAMQDDLVNGTFNSEALETNIAEKLTDLETQYAPKLTEVTAQLAQTGERINNLIVDGTPTEGNTMLLDGAVSADGTNNGTVGTNIRKTQTGEAIVNKAINTQKIGSLSTVKIFNNQADISSSKIWKSGGVITEKTKNSVSFSTTEINNGLLVPVYLQEKELPISFNFTATGAISIGLVNEQGGYISGSNFHTTGGARLTSVQVNKTFTKKELDDFGLSDYCFILFNLPQPGYSATINDLLVNNNNAPSDFDEIIKHVYGSETETDIDNKHTILKVSKTDNDADFTSFVDAVESITDSSFTNTYEIQLLDAEYDVLSELGGQSFVDNLSSNMSEMQGVLLPDYVDLIGMVGKNVKLKMEIPDIGLENVPFFRASTLNLNKTNTLKNLHVIGRNVRYAVHDESNNQTSNYVRTIDNCIFEHLGVRESEKNRWLSQTAYGCGTGSGAVIKATNSDFVGLNYCGFSAHDNYNFEKPNTIDFDNCGFYGQFDVDSIYRGSARFEMLGTTTGSGFDENVFFNNCRFNAPILIRMYEKGFRLRGGGNTKVPYKINGINEGNQPVFSDETLTIRAGETIQYGTPVFVKDGKVWGMRIDTPIGLIKGVLLESVSSGKEATIKVSGYVRGEDLNLSGLVAGQKIGVVNGEYTIVTGLEYFGIAEDSVNVVLT